MFTSPKPKRLAVACFLTCALFVSGLITTTTDVRRVVNNQPPPPVNSPSERQIDEETRGRVSEAYGKLPLSFEENLGQVDAEVRYVSRGAGYTLFLTPAEAVLSLRSGGGAGARGEKQRRRPRKQQSAVLRMKLKNANPAPAVTGESEMGARANYFIGNDPQNWHTDVARFERVRYSQLYPGIDLIYYGQQRQLEYDFEVAPGVDSRQIALEFAGVRRLSVESATGDLVLTTDGGEVRQRRPVAYQEEGGERREVLSRYVMKGEREVGIEVGEYDRTKPLVIDPVLSYSLHLDGANDEDVGTGIAVDSDGIAYVTGHTYSLDFPTRKAYQPELGPRDGEVGPPYTNADAFVTKLNTKVSGSASILYSTYLGGTGGDYGTGIALDSAGNVYVAGTTYANDFPTLNPYQTRQGVEYYGDAFVVKLNPNLSGAASLLYGTYLGGTGQDTGTGIAVNYPDNVYITGYTASTDFPVLNPYQTKQGADGDEDAFVARLNTSLAGAASLRSSTYLGGSDKDRANGIAVDPYDFVYVAGSTGSTNFPTRNQYQKDRPLGDAFVTRLSLPLDAAASILYSTYLGGSSGEGAAAIAADRSGNAYVTGTTYSNDFPTRNAYHLNRYDADAFVTKINTFASGSASFVYSTYLGGSFSDQDFGDGGDYGMGIAVDDDGSVYVTGETSASDFPVRNPAQARRTGEINYRDAFAAKLDPQLSGDESLVYSTYLGGSAPDTGYAVAVDSSHNAYVTGVTSTGNYYRLNEAFVVKLRDTLFIGGRVVIGSIYCCDIGVGGVTVTLTGTQARTVVTNKNGEFAFTNLAKGGSYVVAPAGGSLILSPSSLKLSNLQTNSLYNYFSTRPARISGRVTTNTAYGAGLPGVLMTLTTNVPGLYTSTTEAVTDSTGAYWFDDLPTPGTYKITPSMTHYSFSPAQQSLINLARDQSGVNLVATLKTYTVGGVVRLGAAGLGGVTVRLESPGFAARTATTDSAGLYSFQKVPAGRAYTVTPLKTGYQFTPASKSLPDLSAPPAAVNFLVTAYSISGRVVRTGTTTGVGAVTVTATSPTPTGFPARTAQTTSAGYYTFTSLPAGRDYTLKPAKTGFTFSPTARTILNLSGSIPAGTSTSFTGTGP